ncbi:MAG: bifunctional diguanylate cyclase/phosphodiesterase [Candidatus Devosia phytovorans]|uniref:Bifunctional diguanylate cyclase/phosphodiesterase n=1 Tax=Candidatus Devosia phytovorans TaxID=3121372 RepID=A0AAJ6AYY9_9HYPH|nr:bifunctional diguanylate cyclase/phosphodiesterase [Devosia sp.]WEK03487.1 MAG: bifunctional diguanylate cyclase/phosphodiesterase [Devosia sp.]
MAREMDGAALNEQKVAVTADIEDIGRRIQLEQGTASNRKDGVYYSDHGSAAWVPKTMAEWLSREFKHDRVYAYYLDRSVLQAGIEGRKAQSEFLPADQAAIADFSQQVRTNMSLPSGEGQKTALCCYGVRKLEDGDVAIISVRPLTSFLSSEVSLVNPLLVASVVLLDEEAMTAISQRLGLPGVRIVNRATSPARVPLKDADGRTVAFVQWQAPEPAARLFQQIALPGMLSLAVIGGGIFLLLTWLRRISLSLESSQKRASFLSMHDPLTGAANRMLFEQKLREALQYRTLAETRVLLIAVDLDRFKDVNDTYGHAAGDELLREVGRRLLVELPEEATLGRLGGDEFAIVQPGIVSDGHARWICQRLLQALSDPVTLSNGTIHATVSMGFAIESASNASAAELARRADLALYVSKTTGRNRYTLYDPSMDADRKARLTLQVELRDALLQDALHLDYQPIFNATGGTIAGAEALLRWKHPVRGLLSPDVFIALAEESGLIAELGLWVLRRACLFAKQAELPWIAVNVSPVQFTRPDLADDILHLLAEVDLAANRLEIEITEGVLLQSSPQVQQTLSQLRDAGVRIAIDDFGAGYASISYLRNYTIDKIKIDRSLIGQLAQDQSLRHIVQAIVDMGKAMGLSITAEGVEDEFQRQELTAMGCTYLQGYLLSRPVSPEILLDLLASYSLRPPVLRLADWRS